MCSIEEENARLKLQILSQARELRALGVADWDEIKRQMPKEARIFADLRKSIIGITDDTLRRKLKLMERAGMVEKVQIGKKVGWRPRQ